jgi:hypothetical protein
MKRVLLCLALGVLACWSDLLGAAKPSTPEQRKLVVETTKRLEADPLGPEATGLRTELLKWWTEVPDLNLKWCAGMLLELEKDKDLGGAMVLQAILSAGVVLIEHPEIAKDQRAFAIAGLEGALRAYRAAVAKDPKMRNNFLEGLSKPDALGPYVDTKLPSCK